MKIVSAIFNVVFAAITITPVLIKYAVLKIFLCVSADTSSGMNLSTADSAVLTAGITTATKAPASADLPA